MSTRLLHGVFLGTLVVLVSAFLELQGLFRDWPYHRDRSLVWVWLPLHLLVGVGLGVAGVLLQQLTDSRLGRGDRPGLSLATPILSLWLAAVALLDGWFAPWGGRMVQGLAALAFLAVCLLGLRAFQRSRVSWIVSGFVTPWFSLVGTLALIGLAGLLAWGAPLPARTGPSHPEAAPPQAPHVLLVVLDTVAAPHLGCYGHHRPTSPRLDALAEEGVVFDQAFAAAPWTLPSHASLFTGLHPTSHLTGWRHPRLDDGKARVGTILRYDQWTLAEELAQRGYQTCGVSEKPWLTDRHGLTQGFQTYHDYSIATDHERLRLSRAADRIARRLGFDPLLSQRGGDKGGRRVVERALTWLDQERDPSRPYFLFLNLNEAHAPYTPPSGFADFGRFLPPGAELEDLQDGYFAHAPDRKALNSGARERLAAEAEIQRALYDASILYQDELLGTLIDGLRDQDLLEDTLVVITSDHGEEFGTHGRFGHQLSLHDELLHVPLLMRLPQLLPAQARVAEPVSLVDVFPTVLSVIETVTETAPPPSAALLALEGFDLLPRMRGEGPPPRDWVLAHADNPSAYLAGFPNFATDGSFPLADEAMHGITMLRRGSQKYFRFEDGVEAFVDLQLDPREDAAEYRTAANRGAPLSTEAAEMAQELDQLLNRMVVRRELLVGHLAGLGGADRDPGKAADDDTQLELLGYIGVRTGDGRREPPSLPARIFN